MPREEIVISRVREITGLPFVESVEDHFAGMWNELGIQIKLKSDVPDREVISLRNQILSSLNEMHQEQELPFSWIIGFWRDEKNIEILLPGDQERNVDDALMER